MSVSVLTHRRNPLLRQYLADLSTRPYPHHVPHSPTLPVVAVAVTCDPRTAFVANGFKKSVNRKYLPVFGVLIGVLRPHFDPFRRTQKGR